MILDGAMGTMIQSYKLSEQDFRGNNFPSHRYDLQGNNDILCLTQPQIIQEIHESYFKAGADIIETNTFNANAISQADYGTENLIYEINLHAAQIAKSAAISCNNKPTICGLLNGFTPITVSSPKGYT